VGTSELNRHFEEIVARRPPPSGPMGRHVRLYYVTQADVCPPTFYVSTNLPKAIGEPYRRYLTNQLRQIYGFEGSPLRVALRGRGRKRKGAPATSDAK
jgi:GTP-binding protein